MSDHVLNGGDGPLEVNVDDGGNVRVRLNTVTRWVLVDPIEEGRCAHGVYVGGCGIDWMCGQCESGYGSSPTEADLDAAWAHNVRDHVRNVTLVMRSWMGAFPEFGGPFWRQYGIDWATPHDVRRDRACLALGPDDDGWWERARHLATDAFRVWERDADQLDW